MHARMPACLPAYLPAYLPACLPATERPTTDRQLRNENKQRVQAEKKKNLWKKKFRKKVLKLRKEVRMIERKGRQIPRLEQKKKQKLAKLEVEKEKLTSRGLPVCPIFLPPILSHLNRSSPPETSDGWTRAGRASAARRHRRRQPDWHAARPAP